CTQVICTDKTGTLTMNRMTVVETFTGNAELLYTCNALCNDCAIGENGKATGEPTEAAMCENAYDNGANKEEILKAQPRVAEAPFDSDRKMMSTLHDLGGRIVQYTKGAPDVILSRCSKYISPVDGKIKELDDKTREVLLAHNKSLADKALRVLASAFAYYDSLPEDVSPENIEKDMIFIGLTGMMDPVRAEVVEAVKRCQAAGIRPVMITGDHVDTAVAIGKELGIIEGRSQALTGAQLDQIPEEELTRDIAEYSVYARVQPEHKVRIVNAWKKLGYITAMTGDGVNDAPSIKSADIGIGMGVTGTDVTKGVADMILGDDNFATIVNAAQEGRRIYDNVRKAIQFLLSSNLSEVVGVFVASLFGAVLLKPAHLLWINLITDSIPALGLGIEQAEGDVMTRKPRSSDEGLFANGLGIDVVWQGAAIAALTLLSFVIGKAFNPEFGTTMAFVTMSMAEIFHSLNMRSRTDSIFKMKTQNKLLWGAVALSFVLTSAVIFIPFFRNAFSFEAINFGEYLLAILIGMLIVPISEGVKFIKKQKNK
ncbi:MAG: cation-transporting P-type ATPase, partial [Clostridiales bacterium]|nr:cation-transporting P-type ATPase [Candidatus Coliplasma equi]